MPITLDQKEEVVIIPWFPWLLEKEQTQPHSLQMRLEVKLSTCSELKNMLESFMA